MVCAGVSGCKYHIMAIDAIIYQYVQPSMRTDQTGQVQTWLRGGVRS